MQTASNNQNQRLVVVPVSMIVAIAVLWYLFNPGGYFQQHKAIGVVKSHTITINSVSHGAAGYTVERLIQLYNPDEHKLYTGTLNEVFAKDISWNVSYCGGKFVVGCNERGRLYSFETDMINVTPISDAAQELCYLSQTRFE